jgi:hypothetical protein
MSKRVSRVAAPGSEGHGDAILKIATLPNDAPVSVPYLNWFQAITLADLARRQTCLTVRWLRDRTTPVRAAPQFHRGIRPRLAAPKIMGRISRHLNMGLRKSQ